MINRTPVGSPKRRGNRGSGLSRSLHVECLEARRVLATLTVTSLADVIADDGQLTFREAIMAAENDISVDGSVVGEVRDEIVFDPSLSGGTIDLLQSDVGSAIRVNSDLIVQGAGVTLQRAASDPFRILEIGPDATVSLTNLTVRNGESIRSEIIVREAAPPVLGGMGGGIHNRGNLSLLNVSVIENYAIGDSVEALGGGIYNEGQLVLSDSQVLNNRVEVESAINGSHSAFGGGIATREGTSTITRSQIAQNHAVDSLNQNAIGGGVYQLNGQLTVIDTEISGNGADAYGAGAYIDVRDADSLIERSTLASNVAGFDGGGLVVDGSGTLRLYNSTVSSNEAINGAGIYTSTGVEIIHTTVTANTATDGATVVTTSEGRVSIQNSIVAQNGFAQDVNGNFESLGNNLIGNFFGPSDELGFSRQKNDLLPFELPLDPLLSPLANNGGATRTHVPNANSPAIDNATTDTITPFMQDQRGIVRPLDGNADGQESPDIGAVETEPASIVIDNDIEAGMPGEFVVEVFAGGSSLPNRGRISAIGRTREINGEEAIEAYRHFVRIGNNVSELNLTIPLEETIESGPSLESEDVAISRGEFNGPNGVVTWAVTSRLADGASVLESEMTFESESPLGEIDVLSFLDDRIDENSEQLFLTAAGADGVAAVRVDADQRIGFVHDVSVLEGANRTGWVAGDAQTLLASIEDTTAFDAETGVAGGTSVEDPELGDVTSFADLGTAQRVRIEPTATTATVRFEIVLISEAPTNINGSSLIDGSPHADAEIGLDLDSDGDIDETTTTDGEGQYAFQLVPPGTHRIVRDIPQHWTSVQPMLANEASITVGGRAEETRVDFAATVTGAIEVRAFEDVDADGVFDSLVDQPINGVGLRLSGVDMLGRTIDRTVTTSSDGEAIFEDLVASADETQYLVRIDLSDDFVATTSTEVAIALLPGQVVRLTENLPQDLDDMQTEVDGGTLFAFGAAVPGAVHAFKFEDFDGNGIYDPLIDQPLEDVEVTLTGRDGLGNIVDKVATTDVRGVASFLDLLPSVPAQGLGTGYIVEEISTIEQTRTTPALPNLSLESRDALVAQAGDAELPDASLQQERVLGDALRIGNARDASIFVFTYEDVDGDGAFELDYDRPLGQVNMGLDGTDGLGNLVTRSEQTDASGQLGILGLPPSINGVGLATGYTVSQAVPSPFVPIRQVSTSIDLASGQSVGDERLLFGSVSPAQVSVFKFEDIDGDGIFTQGVDRPMSDVEFQLRGTDGLGNQVSMSVVTDEQGQAAFIDLMPSVIGRGLGTGYTISEMTLGDLVATTPTSVKLDVESGAVLGNESLLFGSARPSRLEAFKFEDVDGDGQYSEGLDLPLAGVEIRMTGRNGLGTQVDSSVVTDADGRAVFEGLLPSLVGVGLGTGYTIGEVVPNGFVATTASENLFDLQSGTRLFGSGSQPLDNSAELVDVFAPNVVDFGNTVPGEIRLFGFEDVDGDGIFKELVDLPLAGVVFTLSGNDALGNTYEETAASDSSGFVSFASLLPSTAGNNGATGYQIQASVPVGFVASTEVNFSIDLQSREVFQSTNDARDVGDQQIVQAQVGSLQVGGVILGSIEGMKFDDRDGDGRFDDEHDVPVVGAEVQLRGVDGKGELVELVAVTDSLGRFRFDNLMPSAASDSIATGYQISHQLPNGHRSRTHEADFDGVLTVDLDLFSGNVIFSPSRDGGSLDDGDAFEDERLNFGSYFAQFTGAFAGFVAAGDITGDGLDDLIVANDYANPITFRSSLSVLFALGDGGFSDPVEIALPDRSRPQTVDLVDVDGDGVLDLLTSATNGGSSISAGNSGNAIFVLRSTGDASLPFELDESSSDVLTRAACSIPTSNTRVRCDGPIDIVTEDFDLDGQLDMAFVSFRADVLTVVLDAFNVPEVLHLPVPRTPVSLLSGLLNDDDIPDLVVASHDVHRVSILHGDGNGNFTNVQSLNVANPSSIVIASLDGDASPDLAVASYDTSDGADRGRVTRYVGTPDGRFAVLDSIDVGEGASSIVAVELNGLGEDELIVTAADVNAVQVLTGDGGRISLITSFSVAPINPSGFGPSPQVVAVGDFDGVGHADFAVAHFVHGVTAYFNGMPVASERLRLTAGDGSRTNVKHDVSGDGHVTPYDALTVINALNRQSLAGLPCSEACPDVNGDGILTPYDALLVINRLNSSSVEMESPLRTLELADVKVAASQAVDIWQQRGLSEAAVAALEGLRFRITDLPKGELSLTYGSTVVLDFDASGAGWHRGLREPQYDSVDSTGVDLLTVMLHEMGHVLGLKHGDSELMEPLLEPGVRRLPNATVDRLFASDT